MTTVPAKPHEATYYLRSASLELTSNCNLRCTYCAVSQPGYQGLTMGKWATGRALAGLREMKTVSVALNGHGETTTVAGWHHAIAQIASWGSLVHLTSNFARAFSEEEIAAILALTSAVISFDTDDAELLRKTRRSVRLETILDNIRRLRAKAAARGVQGPKLVASCVVHTHNVMHLDRFVRFGIGHGIRGFQFCNMVEYDAVEGAFGVGHVASLPRQELVAARSKIVEAGALAVSMGADCETQRGLLDAIDDAIKGSEAPTGVKVEGQRRYAKKPEAGQTRHCLDPWLFAIIQADASVRPCCYHPVIGSLEEQPLSAILNGDAAVALRGQLMTGVLSESCMTCPGRAVVGIREFEATVGAEIPPNWAAGKLARAALSAVQFARGWRAAANHPRV